MAEVLRGEPCVGGAYLIEADAPAYISAKQEPVKVVTHMLAIALDPDVLTQRNEDETRIMGRFRALFREIVPPDQLALTLKQFTTEELPEGYLRHPLIQVERPSRA